MREAMSKYLAKQAARAMKKRRIALGLKQTEAAAKAGVALGTLQKFEQTGGISLERLFRLCYSYGMESPILSALECRDYWDISEIELAESRRIVR